MPFWLLLEPRLGQCREKHCLKSYRDYKIGLSRSSPNRCIMIMHVLSQSLRQTLRTDDLQTRRNILIHYRSTIGCLLNVTEVFIKCLKLLITVQGVQTENILKKLQLKGGKGMGWTTKWKLRALPLCNCQTDLGNVFFYYVYRSLSIVVDVSCDPNSPNNPLPFYDTCTSFKDPTYRVNLS